MPHMDSRLESQFAPLKIVPYNGGRHSQESGITFSRSRKRVPAYDNPNRLQTTVSKIGHACVTCRLKKTRCSGDKPCIRCSSQNQPCHYMDTRRSSHNIIRAAPLELANPPADNASQYVSPNTTPLHDASEATVHRPSTSTDGSLNYDTASSQAAEDSPEQPPQEDQYGHFHGGASGFAFLQFAKQRLSNLPSMSLDFQDYPIPESGTFCPVLPPRLVADGLVSHFFDFGLSTSRFVHRPSLEATCEKLYANGELPAGGQGDLALIYMVLAIGAHYSTTTSSFSGFGASVRYYDIAQKELQKETSKITLSSLQAKLLVTHFLINHSRMHEAWSTFGVIVRQAQALQLHRYVARPANGSFIDYEYRKRLFWSIYIYDRQLSSIFGRPCAFHDDDVDQEEPVLANDDEITITTCRPAENDAFCSAAALVHYSRLVKNLGTILRHFYSPAGKYLGLMRLKEVAIDIEQSLTEWQVNLPAYLNYTSLPPLAMSTITQRQMCTLKLTFAYAQLLLYRPFILHSISSGHASSPEMEVWIKHSYDMSIDSAKIIVAECRELFGRGLFSPAFGLFIYIQFAAIGTLYLYSMLWQDTSHVRELAEDAMREFHIGVNGDPVGQHYLVVLKELRAITGGRQSDITIDRAAATLGVFDGTGFDGQLNELGDPWAAILFDTPVINDFTSGL